MSKKSLVQLIGYLASKSYVYQMEKQTYGWQLRLYSNNGTVGVRENEDYYIEIFGDFNSTQIQLVNTLSSVHSDVIVSRIDFCYPPTEMFDFSEIDQVISRSSR